MYSNTIISYRRPIGIIAGIFALMHMIKFDQKIYELWIKFYSQEQSFISFIFDAIFYKTGSDILGMNEYAFWTGIM
jgi:DMSO/TMAO reductase YedYZ heme-binding membrane subunit